MKKGVISLLLFLFFISLVSSEVQTLGGIDGFPPGTEINLTQICTNCTFVNVTYVVLASGQLQNINQEMTKDGTFYNHPLEANLTTSIGEYVVNWLADPDGAITAGNYNFHVRRNGTLLTTAESFLYIFLAVFNLLAVVFFLFHGINLPYTDERTKDGTLTRLIPSKYLKMLSIWIGYGALLWLLTIISAITNSFISLASMRTLITNLNVYMSVAGYPLTVIILSILLIEVYIDMFVPLFKKFFMNVTKKRRRN
ncbi:MAG TPA: hypothetical protein ENI23_12705 [bacterium]|nr:hypothetical protein [bacterium]